jgi:hypothetical protein
MKATKTAYLVLTEGKRLSTVDLVRIAYLVKISI